MAELGFKLLGLSITEVKDVYNEKEGYNQIENLSAKDREAKRREAENLRAEANRDISTTLALTEREAEEAKLTKRLAIAEKTRDVEIREAEIKSETAEKKAAADFAEQVQKEVQQKNLELKKGDVEVTRQEQAERAAQTEQKVDLVRAETAKKRLLIEAEAAKAKDAIDAESRVIIAERDATAHAKSEELKAAGKAAAERKEAEGKAAARKATADADAEYTRKTLQAKADGIEAEGRAKAVAILEEGKAKAEAEKLLAEARAAEDKVNFELERTRILAERDKFIHVETSRVMANLGQNATFVQVDRDGNKSEENILGKILGNVPSWLFGEDTVNKALNGVPLAASISALSSGILNQETAHNQDKTPKKSPVEIPETDYSVLADIEPETPIIEIAPPEGDVGTNTTAAEEEPSPAAPSATERQAATYAQSIQSKQAAATAKTAAKRHNQQAAASIDAGSDIESDVDDKEDGLSVADQSPSLVAEALEIIAPLAEEQALTSDETTDLAKVFVDIVDNGVSEEKALDLTTQAINSIREFRQSGQKVAPAVIAQSVLGENFDRDDFVDLIGGFAKKASRKRRK
jgi:hypothetical protein